MFKSTNILYPALAVIGALLSGSSGKAAPASVRLGGLARSFGGAAMSQRQPLSPAQAGQWDRNAPLYQLLLREQAALKRKLKSARSGQVGSTGPLGQIAVVRKSVQKRCVLLARQGFSQSAEAIAQAQAELALLLAEAGPAWWYDAISPAFQPAEPSGTAAVGQVAEPKEERRPASLGVAEAEPDAIDNPGPILATVTIEGQPINPHAFARKWVLVDFWATWCGACVAEVPRLKEVYEAFRHDRRFAMISLSIDTDRDAPRRFVDERQLEWTQGFLGKGWAAPLLADYDIDEIPAILLIDPHGRVVARGLRGRAIMAAVARALSNGDPE